jgi:hypothetical protein
MKPGHPNVSAQKVPILAKEILPVTVILVSGD